MRLNKILTKNYTGPFFHKKLNPWTQFFGRTLKQVVQTYFRDSEEDFESPLLHAVQFQSFNNTESTIIKDKQ